MILSDRLSAFLKAGRAVYTTGHNTGTLRAHYGHTTGTLQAHYGEGWIGLRISEHRRLLLG